MQATLQENVLQMCYTRVWSASRWRVKIMIGSNRSCHLIFSPGRIRKPLWHTVLAVMARPPSPGSPRGTVHPWNVSAAAPVSSCHLTSSVWRWISPPLPALPQSTPVGGRLQISDRYRYGIGSRMLRGCVLLQVRDAAGEWGRDDRCQ